MLGKNCKIFLILAFILFFAMVSNASILVKVYPKDFPEKTAVFYVGEIKTYTLAVLNAGADEPRLLIFKLGVDKDLAILDGERQKQEKYFNIEGLKAGEQKNFDFVLKAKNHSNENKLVSASYGFEEYENVVATYARTEESNLKINAVLKNFIVDIGGQGKVLLDLKNNSPRDLNGVEIRVYSQNRIDVFTPKQLIESVKAGESIKQLEFDFSPDPSISGKIPLYLRISFSDSNGFHVLEKQMDVIIESTKFFNSIVLVIILVLIIILSFLLKPAAVPAKK